MPAKLPIAVLISGGGTNLQALIDASATDNFGCNIVGVISDRPDAGGLERAAAAGIPVGVADWDEFSDRSSFTTAMCDKAESSGAQALVLAGLMRVLAPEAMARFPNAIINVHPSMLPDFPGGNSVQEALAAGSSTTGVTIHFVDALVDHGPIIVQEPVAIHHDDDAESLHARIQQVEHRLLPGVVSAFGKGHITVTGGSVTWATAADQGGYQ
jgi:phosphoribosylglycinamide formyltransferase-1